jgi:hypothetical protein
LTLSHVCREAKKGKEEHTEKEFLSPRKHINIPKRTTNPDDFQKYIVCRILSEYYDKGEFHTVKK